MTTLEIGLALVAAYVLYGAFRFVENYLEARKCGFPIYITPIDQVSPFWLIFSSAILPVCKRFLPSTLWRPLDLSTYGFEWRDIVHGRTRPPAWMLIGPGKIDLFLEDPVMINSVLSKRKQFPQEESAMKFLSIVGKNLTSSEGEDWQRQRRLIAPMLIERIMNTVWVESREQARDMLDSFMKEGGTTRGTIAGLRTIAINVLQCIGYGMPQRWGETVQGVPAGHKMANMEALQELIDGFILVAIVRSAKVLTLPFLPNTIRRKGYAMQDFHVYTQELLDKERKAGIESDKSQDNLLSLFATIA
jgi:cytochrome P450